MNRYIQRAALAIVLALSTSPAQAGLNQWTTNGPNDAAIINSIAVDPSNPLTVYAASSKTTPLDGKVFKSTNGGGSWTPTTTGLPGSSVDIIVVDPSNSNTLYVGTFGAPGVLKSTNGGGNWPPVGTGLPNGIVNTIALDRVNSQIVYAGTQSGLFKSTNGRGSA